MGLYGFSRINNRFYLAMRCPIIPFLEEILCKELIIESPKVLQIFNNVSINGRELLIPEFGQIITYRYYFTNNSDPWNIPIEKIEALRPPNQYIYDYAVSKAIKNQTTVIKEIKDEIVKELIMQRPL